MSEEQPPDREGQEEELWATPSGGSKGGKDGKDGNLKFATADKCVQSDQMEKEVKYISYENLRGDEQQQSGPFGNAFPVPGTNLHCILDGQHKLRAGGCPDKNA